MQQMLALTYQVKLYAMHIQDKTINGQIANVFHVVHWLIIHPAMLIY